MGNDILDDVQLTNIKLDDLANSILVQDGPLPEIKKEEVDDIISEIIENAGGIVDDPEQHLQLDGKNTKLFLSKICCFYCFKQFFFIMCSFVNYLFFYF